MKLSVFIAASIDGYIAKMNGDTDWLNSTSGESNNEDYGYREFWDSTDCMVMGRKTMEKALTFPEWPYEGKKIIVLSKTLDRLPRQIEVDAEIYSGDLRALRTRLVGEGFHHIYVDGGQTIRSFLNCGLISDMTITTVPILLGEGVRLFESLSSETRLFHIETVAYPNGFVKSVYEVETERP